MEYDRYFWKSGRNRRKRTAEERNNIKKIVLAFAAMMLFGMLVGLAVILLARGG